MSDITMTKYDAVRWMARLAAADGVVTASERRVIKEFAEAHDIDPHVIYRMAHAIANEVEIPEVEAHSYTEMVGRIFEEFVVSLSASHSCRGAVTKFTVRPILSKISCPTSASVIASTVARSSI